MKPIPAPIRKFLSILPGWIFVIVMITAVTKHVLIRRLEIFPFWFSHKALMALMFLVVFWRWNPRLDFRDKD